MCNHITIQCRVLFLKCICIRLFFVRSLIFRQGIVYERMIFISFSSVFWSFHCQEMENTASTPDVQQTQPSTVTNGGTTSEGVQSEKIQTEYGCLGCHPACLQFLGGARWFLLFTCVAGFCEALVINGLLGVTISTVERRFALSSSQSAWIPASYEIAAAPVLIVIGYLGSSLRRPVWIAGGLIIMGIGFGVYSIPHFAASPYRYSESGDFSNLCAQPMWNSSTNVSSAPNDDRYVWCTQLQKSRKVSNYL